MKWTSVVLTVLAAPALALTWSTAARADDAGTSCVNDVDCTGNGTACGTDVCNWNMGKVCVPAASASLQDNWCGGSYATPYDQATADMECKCYAEGATCMNFHCTIWVLDAGSTGASGASSGTASGSSGTASSGGSTTEDAGSSNEATNGESSGGCSVALGDEHGPLAIGAFGLASCFAAARRRKRYAGAPGSNVDPGSVK